MSAPTEHFDPALVDLIAAGLPSLPHPDGTPYSFPAHVDTFPGDTEEEQQAKASMNRKIAEALLNYIRLHGHSLVSDAQLAQPQRFGEHTIVQGVCPTCAAVVHTATANRDGKFPLPVRTLNPDCESRHGAAV